LIQQQAFAIGWLAIDSVGKDFAHPFHLANLCVCRRRVSAGEPHALDHPRQIVVARPTPINESR
jgi:hypothetical protein